MKKVLILLVFSLVLPATAFAGYEEVLRDFNRDTVILSHSLGNNDMHKRVGELIWMQQAPMEHANNAVWSRTFGRTGEYDDIDHRQIGIEMGYDRRIDQSLYLGLLFHASTSRSKVNDYGFSSKMDTDVFGLGVYSIWISNSGYFVDMVTRILWLEQDGKSDDYTLDRNAFTVSIGVGKEMVFPQNKYITHRMQIGVQYINSDSDISGVFGDVRADSVFGLSIDTGVIFGMRRDFAASKLDHYFRVDLAYHKSQDAEATVAGVSREDDVSLFLGGLGIGATWQIRNFSLFADAGASIGTESYYDINANLGVRYTFGG